METSLQHERAKSNQFHLAREWNNLLLFTSLSVSLALSLFVSLLSYSLVDRAVHYAMLQPSFTIRNAPLPKSIFKINENKARAL